MKCAVIIPAAGSASRYTQSGGLRHKIDEDVGGKVVLQRTVELFTKFEPDEGVLSPIIVAGPNDPAAFADFKLRHADRLAILGVVLCRGGATHRWETVQEALKLVPEDCTHIAVHDAVRCTTPVELLQRVFRAALTDDAVIPAVEIADTLKRSITEQDQGDDDSDPLAAILSGAPRGPRRFVSATVDRAGMVGAQTPQVFKASLLRAAYAAVGEQTSTDDAGVVEQYWASRKDPSRVRIVEGDVRNIKITRPPDLALARSILGVRGPEDKPAHLRF
jgi:2-C-methyl-D-erythritol 4-phosphate cytidylyltransferase